MKILMVNKYFYIKGGSETYYFALKEKLQNEGHIVIDFSMKDDNNFPSKYSDYFVSNVDYNQKTTIVDNFKMAKKIIYSNEAKKHFEKLVINERPDIVHLHIFQHQISPSILDVCKKYNLPTVYTAHDLKMICLNYKMMHHGNICEDCKDGHYYHCIINKCVKNSFSKSFVNVVEGYFHKWRKTYDVIDFILTPSKFYKNKFEEFGVNSNRVIYLPNFLNRKHPKVNKRIDSEKYFLYFGRLSEEKGILTLVNAMKNVGLNLYIVGSGPLEQKIKSYIKENNIKTIQTLGFKEGQELIDLVGNAKAIILPSEWYENGPYSAIEALQLGRPIIGANIGGISELIEGNGYLFESGNAHDLNSKLYELLSISNEDYKTMKERSKNIFEKKYSSVPHYNKLMRVYSKAIMNH